MPTPPTASHCEAVESECNRVRTNALWLNAITATVISSMTIVINMVKMNIIILNNVVFTKPFSLAKVGKRLYCIFAQLAPLRAHY